MVTSGEVWCLPRKVLQAYYKVLQSIPPHYKVLLSTFLYYKVLLRTSSTVPGGGGSFKNRKPIGEIVCCEWVADGRAKTLMDRTV